MQVRVVRIFNTYGPRMALDDGRVVSNFVAQALTGTPMTIYGHGEQTRSFQYVSDLIEGGHRSLLLCRLCFWPWVPRSAWLLRQQGIRQHADQLHMYFRTELSKSGVPCGCSARSASACLEWPSFASALVLQAWCA